VTDELEAIKEEEVYGIQVLSVIDSKECLDNKRELTKSASLRLLKLLRALEE
jgi:hypothetical protein